ncbi:putative Exopolyphosphatase [Rhodotorula diobovata]|uniref:Putative Exopolyphosphatase n=1 Tax=Rhodotorula diobovata TaxID=5288 RepID=A0A5C5G9Y7_9BASI|nr:putative Exopolyphosphatase [Rhodotorula diobovata]
MTTTTTTTSYLDQLARDKRDFLEAVRQGQGNDDWVVTVGNEAGDLDSLASALGYAHFAAQRSSTSSPRRRYVPLVLTARPDLHLRPENVLALSSAGVDPSLLLTIDDLPSPSSSSSSASSSSSPLLAGRPFALVDHNALLAPFRARPSDPSDRADDARVVAIVDHHADEGRHLGARPRRIEVVGSCASLVVDEFLGGGGGDGRGEKEVDVDVPRPVADLLLSSIVIDTRLKPVADGGKATTVDLSAVEALLPLSSFSPSSSSLSTSANSSTDATAASTAALDALKAHNARLSHAKEDVSHLSARDLLRRDYKEYLSSSPSGGVRYGLSTVPLPLSTLLDAPPAPAHDDERVARLVRDVRAWMDERELDLAGVLTSFVHVKRKSGKEGKHRREVMLVLRGGAAQARALEHVFGALEGDEVLRLKEWKERETYGVSEGGWDAEGKGEGEGEGEDRWRIWQQGNDRATRKQVAPSLKSAVELAVGGGAAAAGAGGAQL